MNFWDVIVRFFQGGGDFMYPIAVVLVIGLSIAIERYIYLTRVCDAVTASCGTSRAAACAGQLPAGGADHLQVGRRPSRRS